MDDMTARIKIRIKKLQSDSPELKKSLILAGMRVSNEAKINIKRQKLIDTGNLLNSLSYQVISNDSGGLDVQIGSWGVPYASYWEYGYKGSTNVKKHKRLLKTGKVSEVRSHIRNISIKSRPYLNPAFEKFRSKIEEDIKKALV